MATKALGPPGNPLYPDRASGIERVVGGLVARLAVIESLAGERERVEQAAIFIGELVKNTGQLADFAALTFDRAYAARFSGR